MRWRIAIGFAIVTILLFALVFLFPALGGTDPGQFLPNLVTELIGIILTVAVVDGLLPAREEADKRARAALAYHRMKPVTESLFEPLSYMILGVQPKRPAENIESVEELLSANLINELEFLDPEALLDPKAPKVARRVVTAFEELANSAAQAVDNYGLYIPYKYLRLLEDLLPAKHLSITQIPQFSEVETPHATLVARDLGRREMRNKANKELIDYCRQVRSLVNEHNKLVDEHNRDASSDQKIERIEKMPQLYLGLKQYPGEYRLPDNARPN